MKLINALIVATTAAEQCGLSCPDGKICDFDSFGAEFCRKAKTCDILQCDIQENEICSPKDKKCICQSGFIRHNQTNQCVPDPCDKNTTICSRFAECSRNFEINGSISPMCKCKEGKVGDGVECVADKCYSGKDRCGLNSNCKMVKLGDRWDYECFCKKNHVSYSTRHPDLHQRDNKTKINYGGYRETCAEFNCPLKLEERKEIGFQNSTDERYKIFLPKNDESPLAWEAAKQMCMEFGNLWDLAVISTPEEMEHLVELSKCSHHAFWIGVKKPWIGSGFRTIFNEPAKYLPWTENFPSTNEREQCVRMHMGKVNNANCRSATSAKRTNTLPMGYICERHSRRPDTGVKCEAKDNQRIDAYKTPKGCPRPQCLAKGKFKVIDAWKKKSSSNLYQFDYGFSALVTLPSDGFDGNGASLLMRFPHGNRQGNIQTWNMKFFGFYNNNNDILLHTKWFNTDRAGQSSVLITVDNINTPDYPDILYWPQRVTQHHCFQNSGVGRSSAGSSVTDFAALAKSLNERVSHDEDVTSVSFKNGAIKRVGLQ